MSNHNYSQYSKKNNSGKHKPANYDKPTVDETVTTVEAPLETMEVKMEYAKPVELITETVCAEFLPKTVSGVVIGCTKLNVRSAPGANVIAVLNGDSKVDIDPEKSTKEWVKVVASYDAACKRKVTLDGYCMRKFVDANL